MTPQELLYGIVAACNTEDVEAVLNDYADSLGLGDYTQLPSLPYGGRDANLSSIQAMRYVGNAAYEKVTNMHDAVTALLKERRWFRSNPQNATDALREIAERQGEGVPGAYLAIAHAAPLSTQDGRSRKEANVTFIDEGVGIAPGHLPSTILSLGGSNKMNDPLMAGCYGHGGSAIHGFSRFSLVLSRSHRDPNVISFTVVYVVLPKDARMETYVYLTDAAGEILTVNVSTLDSTRFVHPGALDSDGEGEDAPNIVAIIRDKLILPDQGTVVKVWNLENSPFDGGNSTYNFLRDRGFGLEVPTRLRVGVATQDENDEVGKQRRRQNVVGMRNLLSGTVARAGGRDTYRNIAMKVGVGEAFEGQADITCWVRDYTESAKTNQALAVKQARLQGKSPPTRKPLLEGQTGLRERVTTPIYVTLNGMSHHNMHSSSLLKRAGLEYLVPNMMMEINCDNLDLRKKGRVFISSRESMKTDPLDALREDILRWLRNEAENPDSPLSQANRQLRNEAVKEMSANSQKTTESFMTFTKSPILGSVISDYGNPLQKPEPGESENIAKGGEGEQPKPGKEDGGEEREIKKRVPAVAASDPLKAIPTKVQFRKATIQAGTQEYVKVRIDGTDDWDDAVSIRLPGFLRQLNRPKLESGRISYLIEATGDVGATGDIEVSVDRSRVGYPDLTATCTIEIIRKIAADPGAAKPAPKPRNAIPDVRLVTTSPSSPSWSQVSTGETDEKLLAMAYTQDSSGIVVFWNTEFKPFETVTAMIEKDFSAAARDHVLAETQSYAKLLALTHASAGRDVSETDKVGWGQALAAQVVMNAASMTKQRARSLGVQADDEEEDLAA